MYLLDTDHISLLDRGGAEGQRIRARIAGLPANEEIAATIISYEERTRGWFSYLAQARSAEAQVIAYQRLKKHLADYCAIPVIEFDEKAMFALQKLKSLRLKVGTMDLKIAAIALSSNAILLTRNVVDFERVPGLKTDDWTLSQYEM